MSTNKKPKQRIKLRRDGSPVKWDATIVAHNPNSLSITVEFDAEFIRSIMSNGS